MLKSCHNDFARCNIPAIDILRNSKNYNDKVAISSNTKDTSYKELREKSLQVANYLQSIGVKKGDVVVILLDRNEELIISILAVSIVGAIYLPITKIYPLSLIEFMISDSNAKFIISEKVYNNSGLDHSIVNVVLVDVWSINVNIEYKIAIENIDENVLDSDIAYILYTSGSTGLPKGVPISHEALSNDIYHILDHQIPIEYLFRTLFSSNICFDQSVEEIYPALLSGMCVVIADNILDDFWVHKDITLIITTPSSMQVLLDRAIINSSVKAIVLGGEDFSISLLDDIFENTCAEVVYNSYGPTECTDQACVKKYLKNEKIDCLSIGYPIQNTRIKIVDEQYNLVENNNLGQIIISGKGVFKGYLNRPNLNDNCFVILSCDNNLYFKTGDYGRLNSTGEIEYIGRIDKQTKVNGVRVDLNMIANTIRDIKDVENAYVITEKSNIYAFITPSSTSSESVYKYLCDNLPSFMLPNKIVNFDDAPLTLNGKLDTKALLNIAHTTDEKCEVEFISKLNDLERRILQIVSNLLSRPVSKITLESNFFEIGGHSLLAYQLLSIVKNEFKKVLTYKSFLSNPTIKHLANTIALCDSTNVESIGESIIDVRVAKTGFGKVLIIGGGISGIKTALELQKKSVDYLLIDSNDKFGGIWLKSNVEAKLQTASENYYISEKYKFDIPYPTRDQVINYCNNIADSEGISNKSQFETEVVSIKYGKNNRFVVRTRGVKHKNTNLALFDSIIVCTGSFQRPLIPRWASLDKCSTMHASNLSNVELLNNNVVIVGAGSYAIEAMRIAHERKAKSVTVISRNTYWVLPKFAETMLNDLIDVKCIDDDSRLLDIEERLVHLLVKHYKIYGLDKLIPKPENRNLGAKTSTSDSFFKNSENTNFILSEIENVSNKSVTTKNGKSLHYDKLILATGYHSLDFKFLNTLETGCIKVPYKGYFLLNEPRITFMGLCDHFVTATFPLDINFKLCEYSICNSKKRPNLETIKNWVATTPIDMVKNSKTHVRWLINDL